MLRLYVLDQEMHAEAAPLQSKFVSKKTKAKKPEFLNKNSNNVFDSVKSPDELAEIVFLGHSNTDSIGNFESEVDLVEKFDANFSYKFKNEIDKGANPQQKVKHIYIVGCEAALKTGDKPQLAQRIANEFYTKGYTNVVIHAVASPKDIENRYKGMRVEVFNRATKALGVEAGLVKAFVLTQRQDEELSRLEKARNLAIKFKEKTEIFNQAVALLQGYDLVLVPELPTVSLNPEKNKDLIHKFYIVDNEPPELARIDSKGNITTILYGTKLKQALSELKLDRFLGKKLDKKGQSIKEELTNEEIAELDKLMAAHDKNEDKVYKPNLQGAKTFLYTNDIKSELDRRRNTFIPIQSKEPYFTPDEEKISPAKRKEITTQLANQVKYLKSKKKDDKAEILENLITDIEDGFDLIKAINKLLEILPKENKVLNGLRSAANKVQGKEQPTTRSLLKQIIKDINKPVANNSVEDKKEKSDKKEEEKPLLKETKKEVKKEEKPVSNKVTKSLLDSTIEALGYQIKMLEDEIKALWFPKLSMKGQKKDKLEEVKKILDTFKGSADADEKCKKHIRGKLNKDSVFYDKPLVTSWCSLFTCRTEKLFRDILNDEPLRGFPDRSPKTNSQ